MPVRVIPDDPRLNAANYPTGVRFEPDDHGVLYVYDRSGKALAAHAYGRWNSVEVEPERAEGGPISPPLAYNGPDEREAFVASASAEAVLSETTEPYVSVNLSVTSDDAGQVLKVIREALRDGSLRIPAKALA